MHFENCITSIVQTELLHTKTEKQTTVKKNHHFTYMYLMSELLQLCRSLCVIVIVIETRVGATVVLNMSKISVVSARTHFIF